MPHRTIQTKMRADGAAWEHIILNRSGKEIRREMSYSKPLADLAYSEGKGMAIMSHANWQGFDPNNSNKIVQEVIGDYDPATTLAVADMDDVGFYVYTSGAEKHEANLNLLTSIYVEGLFDRESLLQTRNSLDRLIKEKFPEGE